MYVKEVLGGGRSWQHTRHDKGKKTGTEESAEVEEQNWTGFRKEPGFRRPE